MFGLSDSRAGISLPLLFKMLFFAIRQRVLASAIRTLKRLLLTR